MKWIKSRKTDNFICPHCGYMVRDDGYGGCDFQFCPYCGRPVEPVKEGEQDESKD